MKEGRSKEGRRCSVQGVPSARGPGLDLVYFDLGVPPSCPLLPNSHQPKQNWADSGTLKIQVDPPKVLDQMNYPVVVGGV